jgi:very-short-patch-repair endonuclease
LGMRRQRLKWHYRSRKEGLIAFSNYHFYENSLITFPSAHENFNNPLDFTFLPDGTYENNVNVLEARKIAEMVMEHFQKSPEQSLGVIAFSVSQQNRILDELEIQRRTKPHLEEFFSPEKPERFFVKNLENVQGDERDVIFLGVGYGPNSARKVFMRFGPLNLKGGERRLNVAVTRARAGMKVISSMMPDQINLSNTNSLGAKLLRSFLDYAARGTVALSQAITSTGPGSADSPFEEAVCDALTQRGLKLQKQVGCGGFRIDLAVLDDKVEGKYILGIECDGATYHSSATARDRDRLRQQVLEGLGWSICRIWSTDWVQNRERQIQRVLDALVKVRNGSYSKMPTAVPIKETNQQLLQEEVEEEIEQGFDFKSIDDVPPSVILELIQKTLVECGATERIDLMKTISKKLGFKRFGTNIEKKIDKILSRQLLKGRLQEDANEKLSWRSQESWIQPEIQE